MQARFPTEAVTFEGDAPSTWTRVGDEGTSITFRFCGTCGATLWYAFADSGDVVVPVGAFADASFPTPTVTVYEARRHPWVGGPEGAERWD